MLVKELMEYLRAAPDDSTVTLITHAGWNIPSGGVLDCAIAIAAEKRVELHCYNPPLCIDDNARAALRSLGDGDVTKGLNRLLATL